MIRLTRPSALTAVAWLALLLPLAVFAAPASPLEPTLGRKGRLLLEETFAANQVPAGWNKNTGELAIVDGALRATELAREQHLGAFRKALPLQDCVIQLDLKFDGATTFHLGFDPAPRELKKTGHLFSVVVTPTTWSLMEHVNKSDPKSKNVVHAKANAAFPRGQWVTLLLEVKGSAVLVHAAGMEPLRASAADFKVKKPGLVFRVGGKDGQGVLIDNVKVWSLE